MMDYRQLRRLFVLKLEEYLDDKDCRVVSLRPDAPKPDYPYLGYTLITPYSPGVGFVATEGVTDGTDGWEYDFQYDFVHQPTVTFSFTACAADEDTATEIAKLTHEWFEFVGYMYLSQNGVVVVEAMDVENRDTMLDDDLEFRRGFDVRLRLTDRVRQRLETIEEVRTRKGEIG